MDNVVLRSASLLAFILFFACAVNSAISGDLNSEVAGEQNAIIAKWNNTRATAIHSVKLDPDFARMATHEIKLRKSYQMFLVVLLLEACDIHQETALLRLKLSTRSDASEREVEQLRLRISTLNQDSLRVRKRMRHLKSDQSKGLEIKIDSIEKLEQLEFINKMQWKLPIDLTPRLIAA